MYTAKLSSKGQIVVPKEVRDAHGWQPGDEFVIVEEQGGIQLRPVRACRRLKASDLYGRLERPEAPRTVREMDEAVARMFRDRQ